MSSASRTRTKGGFAVTSTLSQYDRHQSCAQVSPVLVYGPVTSLISGSFESMKDVVTPRFQRLQKEGKTIFNPMSYEKRVVSGSGTGYFVTSVANKCASPAWVGESEGVGDCFSNLLPKQNYNGYSLPVVNSTYTDSFIADAVSEVSTRMMSNRGRSDSNLWESLAELDQTADMFKEPLAKLQKQIKSAKRAKALGNLAGYAANGVSNLWLAYRYGIRPIISDIQGIVSGLQKRVGNQRKTTRGSRNTTVIGTSSSFGTFGMLKVNYNVYNTDSLEIRAMSLDEVNITLANNLGFTSKGLITLPWELVTLSFVADWLANTGDLIGAYVPALGYTNLGSALTVKRIRTSTYESTTGSNLQPATYNVSTYPTGRVFSSLEQKYRVPVPAPRLVVRSDFGFDKFTRSADAIALAGQQMKRLFK